MTLQKQQIMLSIIIIGFIIILTAVVTAAITTSRNIRNLKTISHNLYEHPFVVNNATGNLRSALYAMRNAVLQSILFSHKTEFVESNNALIADLHARITDDIKVIRTNFLGEMSKVDELEERVSAWELIQKKILLSTNRKDINTGPKMISLAEASSINDIDRLIDYILVFANNKGSEFTQNVEDHSNAIISQTDNLLILLTSVVIATALFVLWRVMYLQKTLNTIATIDFLTGIPNRRYFMEMSERELRRSLRYGNNLALAVVDLDHFKQINDTYGHQVGDTVLKQFCRICESDLRDTDIFGRIGGEEFAIVLPNTSLLAAREVIERIREDIENSKIEIGKGEVLQFTACFGLAEHENSKELDVIIKFADKALYQAKESGRNKVVIHENQVQEYQI